MKPNLIAPCGMNNNLCIAHLIDQNRSVGRGGSDEDKCVTRTRCFIKNYTKEHHRRDCSGKCDSYPCQRLSHLDKRLHWEKPDGLEIIASELY